MQSINKDIEVDIISNYEPAPVAAQAPAPTSLPANSQPVAYGIANPIDDERCDVILEHLALNDHIHETTAFILYNIAELPRVIRKLRAKGIPIRARKVALSHALALGDCLMPLPKVRALADFRRVMVFELVNKP